jgi:hypothetical protein
MALSRRSLVKRIAAGAAATAIAPKPVVAEIMPDNFVTAADHYGTTQILGGDDIKAIVSGEEMVVAAKYDGLPSGDTLDVMSSLDVLYSAPSRELHPFDLLRIVESQHVPANTAFAFDTASLGRAIRYGTIEDQGGAAVKVLLE